MCTRACGESMNDVTDNAKNNFGDPLGAMYITCTRSVSENIGLLLKNLYMVSDNFDILGAAFVPRFDAITMNFFGTQKRGVRIRLCKGTGWLGNGLSTLS